MLPTAPPSAAQPSDPAPAVATSQPRPTTVPTTAPTISALWSDTQVVVALQAVDAASDTVEAAVETALLTELTAEPTAWVMELKPQWPSISTIEMGLPPTRSEEHTSEL